ncbi:MAG TPA: hypothetical protein VF690_11010 [Hymenobacter sp.]|jgi:anti-anti-sigma regulatory factor
MSLFSALALPCPSSSIPQINLDDVWAVHRACAQLQSLPPEDRVLRVDCGQLACQRALGVSHVVSQLLLLRRAGASLRLQHVNPALRHCLELLRLDGLFLVEAGE